MWTHQPKTRKPLPFRDTQVEPGSCDIDKDSKRATTLTLGNPGIIHGFKCYILQYRVNPPLFILLPVVLIIQVNLNDRDDKDLDFVPNTYGLP